MAVRLMWFQWCLPLDEIKFGTSQPDLFETNDVWHDKKNLERSDVIVNFVMLTSVGFWEKAGKKSKIFICCLLGILFISYF